MKRWRSRHKEEISAWRMARREALLAYRRAYYAKNRGKSLQQGRDYYAANKERVNARNCANYRKNPLKHRTYWTRRRAMIRDQSARHVDFAAILRRDGWVCHICGGLVAPGELSFDHIIPLSKGGQHSEDNLAIAHLTCNKRKGARTDISSLAPPRIKR
jgi:5-methylcytosine-specific restriction endonuclease McrA